MYAIKIRKYRTSVFLVRAGDSLRWKRRVLGRAEPSLVGESLRGKRRLSSRVVISRVLYPLRGDDHLSGRIVTDRLKRPTRILAVAGRSRLTCVSGILLGLAPDEVYRAVPVARSAVSSYLAISPLPCPNLRPNLAVCFLLHCLSRFRAWTLSSILPCGARTFLQHCCRRSSATQT